tara:strand:+ start:177 stop:506 length:330 start_codon:yes stop_codon:yes gene_type:complete
LWLPLKRANLRLYPAKTVKNVVVHVSVIAKKAASVSPDAVKQNAHHLLVALTEELLTFNLRTASLLVVLTEEPLTSGLRHVVDLLKIDLLKVDLLKVDLLLIDTLDIKR